jgi:zinc D-Ala-D-Ala dipeptidase
MCVFAIAIDTVAHMKEHTMTLVAYENVEIKETDEPLVNLAAYPFILDPAYYNMGLSASPEIHIRKTIADKLLDTQNRIGTIRFKIWDGWRPRDVQHQIYMQYWRKLETKHPKWPKVKLEQEVGKFVSVATDPHRIPIHATGGAIDLTLTDNSGQDLEMGTGFDHFGPESAALYYEKNDIDEQVRANRGRLRELMVAAGFRHDDDEWWHFDYGNQIWAASTGRPYAVYGDCHP